MAGGWYLDRGLATLIAQWRRQHPGAVVGTIADENHTPPSEHLPEEDGSVDAGDFMPGGTVTQAHLDELAETLRRHRDPRIAYVIRRNRIFSSTVRPWEWRPYTGAYHDHTHVSVNDKHENDTRTWAGVGWEGMMADLDKVAEVVERIDRRGPVWHKQDEGSEPRADGSTYGWKQIRTELAELRAAVDARTDPGPIDYDQLAAALLRQIPRP